MSRFTNLCRTNTGLLSQTEEPSSNETVTLSGCIGARTIPRLLPQIQSSWTTVSIQMLWKLWVLSVTWQKHSISCFRCYPINSVLADPYDLDQKLREYSNRVRRSHYNSDDSDDDSDSSSDSDSDDSDSSSVSHSSLESHEVSSLGNGLIFKKTYLNLITGFKQLKWRINWCRSRSRKRRGWQNKRC